MWSSDGGPCVRWGSGPGGRGYRSTVSASGLAKLPPAETVVCVCPSMRMTPLAASAARMAPSLPTATPKGSTSLSPCVTIVGIPPPGPNRSTLPAEPVVWRDSVEFAVHWVDPHHLAVHATGLSQIGHHNLAAAISHYPHRAEEDGGRRHLGLLPGPGVNRDQPAVAEGAQVADHNRAARRDRHTRKINEVAAAGQCRLPPAHRIDRDQPTPASAGVGIGHHDCAGGERRDHSLRTQLSHRQ